MSIPNIILAEDHDLVREGFRAILESDDRIRVMAEAKDGEMALEQAIALRPDLLIIDLSLPRMSGMAVISQLKKAKNKTKIIVLTAADAPNVWKEALDFGVNGVALKTINKEELVEGVLKAIDGGIFIHSQIQQPLMDYKALVEANQAEASGKTAQDAEKPDKPKKPVKVSVREKQIIKLVAEGYKTKDIAEELGISDRTVSKHRENIMTKLGFTASAEMVNYANHIGLLKVSLEEIK